MVRCACAGVRSFDLAVVGAGSAAEAAAMEARRRGRSVVLIEKGLVGGTCPSVGCVPSKSLLASAAVRASAERGGIPGIVTSAGPTNLGALVGEKDAMLAEIRRRDHIERLASEGVEVLAGSARFIESETDGRPKLSVTDVYGVESHIAADDVIIASGAQPFVPDIPGIEDIDYLTYATAMSLNQLPESLVVIGGNAVGLEQAQLFARLGSAVTVVDSAPRIAPFEDAAVSAALQGSLEADGITFHTGVTVTAVKSAASGVEVTLLAGSDLATVAGEKVLIATGRRPATDGLGLEVAGVATGRRGEVVVDEHLRTSHPHVWAAGDVTGIAQFVYVAHAQGVAAAANALAGERRTLDYAALPRVTFTSPAVAAVGLTAAEAAAAGVTYAERELSMSNVPRALLDRMPHGVLKLVSDAETQRLIGIHMVGEGAGDVVGVGALLVATGVTIPQIAEGWVPSFTMAEALAFAAQLPPAVGR